MPSISHTQRCLGSNRFGDGLDCICEPDYKALCNQKDEEFAQFVFTHFGGYWTLANNQRALMPHESQIMKDLPKKIHDRVTEMVREFELKRGGP